jgi:hypothetical protein
MEDKNHDYGEAWRTCKFTNWFDFTKILRVKQIEDNKRKTLVLKGSMNMINYSIFALILMGFELNKKAITHYEKYKYSIF